MPFTPSFIGHHLGAVENMQLTPSFIRHLLGAVKNMPLTPYFIGHHLHVRALENMPLTPSFIGHLFASTTFVSFSNDMSSLCIHFFLFHAPQTEYIAIYANNVDKKVNKEVDPLEILKAFRGKTMKHIAQFVVIVGRTEWGDHCSCGEHYNSNVNKYLYSRCIQLFHFRIFKIGYRRQNNYRQLEE